MNALEVGAKSCSAQDLSFLWLEITARCNLECIHCYAESGPRQQLFGAMSCEAWLTILREAASLGCRQVQFIGGEPTLHPDLAKMIESASVQGYEFIEVYTNATHLEVDMLRLFARHNVRVAFSFYSDDPETHDTITKRRGSFERTVASLRRLAEAALPVRAGIIETPENRGHGERARQFLKNIGVIDAKIDVQRGVGRAANPAGHGEPMAELCGECWKGKLCVTSSGTAYPCVFSRFAQVGRATDGVGAIVSSDRMSNFRRELKNYEDTSVTKHKGHRAEAGCTPNCSPCEPGVFKCAPGCRPASYAPRFGNGAQGTDDPRVEGMPTDSRAAVVSPAALQCNPNCSPTCAPCGPGDFKDCAPSRTHAAIGVDHGANVSEEG